MLTEKDHSIIRQACIKAAAEVYASRTDLTGGAETIVDIATDFEAGVVKAPKGTEAPRPLIDTLCTKCNSKMKFVNAGISKAGRHYPAFWVCDGCKQTQNEKTMPF